MTPIDISSSEMQAARGELQAQTKAQIEWMTARKWCARALAAYEFFLSSRDLQWLVDAVAYHGEAIEHAAHAGPEQLAFIEKTLARAERAALLRAC
jgi:hypothetical protein